MESILPLPQGEGTLNQRHCPGSLPRSGGEGDAGTGRDVRRVCSGERLGQKDAIGDTSFCREDFLMELKRFNASPFQYSAQEALEEAGYA